MTNEVYLFLGLFAYLTASSFVTANHLTRHLQNSEKGLKFSEADAESFEKKAEAVAAAVGASLTTAEKITRSMSGMGTPKKVAYSWHVEEEDQHENALVGKLCYTNKDCDPEEECRAGLPELGIAPFSSFGLPAGGAFESFARGVVKAPFSETMMCAPRLRPSDAATAAKQAEYLRREEGLKEDLQAVLFKNKPLIICKNPTVTQVVADVPDPLDVSGDSNELFEVTVPTGDSLFIKVTTLFPKKQTVAGQYLFDCTQEGTYYEKFAVEAFDGFNSFQVALNVCLAQFDCVNNLAVINFADIDEPFVSPLETEQFNDANDGHNNKKNHQTRYKDPELPLLAADEDALRRYRQRVGIVSTDTTTGSTSTAATSAAQTSAPAAVNSYYTNPVAQPSQIIQPPQIAQANMAQLAQQQHMMKPPPAVVPPFTYPSNLFPQGGAPSAYLPQTSPAQAYAQSDPTRASMLASSTVSQFSEQSKFLSPTVTCTDRKIISAKVHDHFSVKQSDLIVLTGGRADTVKLLLTAGPNKGKTLSLPQEFECDTAARGRIEIVAIVGGPGGIGSALCSQQYECKKNEPPTIGCLPNNKWNVEFGKFSKIDPSQIFLINDPDNSRDEVDVRIADSSGLMMGKGLLNFQCPARGEFPESYLITATDGIHSTLRMCDVTYVCV
eukprot:GHVN01076991.1.p1 GENE.GHVN01076991.1~~GHVN01076991.1.p1  ORF type:complete len:667 (+),score=73.03 GHVN01076991.1:39-2039(+)